MFVYNGGPLHSVEEAVLFPFDCFSIPFNKGLLLNLVPGRKTAEETGHGYDPEHPGKPVVSQGKSEDPDCLEVVYYGSVLHVDSEYRM